MREPVTRVSGIAAPMRWSDVNTDDIFPGPMASPIARLRGGGVLGDRARMGENAFAAHRWTETGEARPDFVLNRVPYDRAVILIAGANFGCGSSRESAVWGLVGIGIRSVVAPSFGDIFYGNCLQNGVLAVRLTESEVEALMGDVESFPEPTVIVDLETLTVTSPAGATFGFTMSEYHREALIHGLDEIDATLARLPAIERFEVDYFRARPWLEATP
jgi:3-isopropylmalate/(R)-2-methylmalate dehydratase small subunit